MEQLTSAAAELLASGKVHAVVGFARGSVPGRARTFIARTPADAQKLIFNKHCVNNLTVYVTRAYPLLAKGPVAVVVKGCDAPTINALLQEKQITRGQVFLIGVPCEGVEDNGSPLPKCAGCQRHNPAGCDLVLGDPVQQRPPAGNPFADVAVLEAQSARERWGFWQAELERCVKCYACRQACPLCYCEQCVVDKAMPRWIDTAATPSGNLSWHITRAFHLAGRCIGCGECERACHQNIPLSLLNKKMAKDVFNFYGYRAGTDPDAKPVLADFRMEDQEEFIR